MSSAILYLAIVAIWAGVLIPRWLKRDGSRSASADTADHDLDPNDEPIVEAPLEPEADLVDRAEIVAESTLAADAATSTYLSAPTLPPQAPVTEVADPGYDEDEDGFRSAEPVTREKILSARRRMLLMLITLTVAAIGISSISLAAWWVTIPPLLMLGGYIMLLREARRADAEHAMLAAAARHDEALYRAEQRRQREEDRRRAAERRRREARLLEPTARIFDISERVSDEFYDQYADAEQRAVGD